MLFTPFRASSSTVCSWAWRNWRSSPAPAASEPSTRTDKPGSSSDHEFGPPRSPSFRRRWRRRPSSPSHRRHHAQEIAESHLKAARAAIDAINATDTYDIILPQAAAGAEAAADPAESRPAGADHHDRRRKGARRWPARAPISRARRRSPMPRCFPRPNSTPSPPSTIQRAGQEAARQWTDRRPRSGQGRRNLAARHRPRPCATEVGKHIEQVVNGMQGSGCSRRRRARAGRRRQPAAPQKRRLRLKRSRRRQPAA